MNTLPQALMDPFLCLSAAYLPSFSSLTESIGVSFGDFEYFEGLNLRFSVSLIKNKNMSICCLLNSSALNHWGFVVLNFRYYYIPCHIFIIKLFGKYHFYFVKSVFFLKIYQIADHVFDMII